MPGGILILRDFFWLCKKTFTKRNGKNRRMGPAFFFLRFLLSECRIFLLQDSRKTFFWHQMYFQWIAVPDKQSHWTVEPLPAVFTRNDFISRTGYEFENLRDRLPGLTGCSGPQFFPLSPFVCELPFLCVSPRVFFIENSHESQYGISCVKFLIHVPVHPNLTG